jgi:hypothetical protein
MRVSSSRSTKKLTLNSYFQSLDSCLYFVLLEVCPCAIKASVKRRVRLGEFGPRRLCESEIYHILKFVDILLDEGV